MSLSNIVTEKLYSEAQLITTESLINSYQIFVASLKSSNFNAIEELYLSIPYSTMRYLHKPAIAQLQEYQSFTFDNRFLHYARYKEAKQLNSALCAIFNKAANHEDLPLTAKL